jgi:protein-S-isoprenylcysteine O-methyltransferase Ste14
MNTTFWGDEFHLTFCVLFAALAGVRGYYHSKAKMWLGKKSPEGAVSFFFRVWIAVPALLATIVYLFWPRILDWASFPLATGWRWSGAGILALGIPFLIWIQRALGRNFSPELRIRDDHTLVTSGPYRYMRHPMYTASLLVFVGMGLLSANWFIGGAGLFATAVIMIYRTPREEAMMVGAFGDRYLRYRQSTGKFLPHV